MSLNTVVKGLDETKLKIVGKKILLRHAASIKSYGKTIQRRTITSVKRRLRKTSF